MYTFRLLAYIFPLNKAVSTLFTLFIFLDKSEAVNICVLFDLFYAFICALISVKNRKMIVISTLPICLFLQTILGTGNWDVGLV